jgi:nitrite reductase/ring-hydroxylating ferredoxin subunit
VLLHRQGMAVSAMENACPHAGGPLDEGTVSDGVVTCPWHGSRFRLSDGACVRGPSTFPQLRLEARVENGMVEVRGRAG